MNYKGYQASIVYWDEDKAFYGEVVNISGGIFSSELHARAKSRGDELGLSLNKFIRLAVERELEEPAS